MARLPLLFITGSLFFTVLTGYSVPAQTSHRVTVRRQTVLSPVDQRFWGANFLFWIDDDSSLSDGRIEQAYKDIPVSVLRYPGGTVADNYHWETNLLDNNNMFPYEEGTKKTDFDEFMAFCGRVGAEPILVVNTQSWFLKDDVEGGAAQAAGWVSYCREKGYNVRYWEIGNETYWHPVMTAREYGRLVRLYAQEMKKADPSILVGANGHWDLNMAGAKERTDSRLWEQIRQSYLAVKTKDDYRSLSRYIDSVVVKPMTMSPDKWWEGVITECGDVIDMVSVHWYFHDNTIKHIDKKIGQLKKFLKKKQPDKDYLYCLTEFNCNSDELEYRVPGLAEGIGRFLNSGFGIGCFWPARINGFNTVNRSMLDMVTQEPQYPHQIYSLFAGTLKGNMLICDSPPDLFSFASEDPEGLTLVVSGRSLGQRVTVTVDTGLPARSAEMTVCGADPEGSLLMRMEKSELTMDGDDFVTFAIDPLTFVVINIKK